MSSGNDLVLREDLSQQIDVPAQKGQVVADLVVKLPALAGVASRKGSPIPYRMVPLCPSPHRQGLRGTRQSRKSAPIEYRIRDRVKSSDDIPPPLRFVSERKIFLITPKDHTLPKSTSKTLAFSLATLGGKVSMSQCNYL